MYIDSLGKTPLALYRKAPAYRIERERWWVVSVSLAESLQRETETKNTNPSMVNDIHYGDVDQIKYLYTEDQVVDLIKLAKGEK